MPVQFAIVPLSKRAALETVDTYEHPELVERLKRELNLDEEQAQQLFSDTKRFLYLCATSNEPLAPTEAIDAGWHEFLMYTKDYYRFCMETFDHFVHHVPTPVLSPHVVRKPINTLQLARDTFGEISANWLCETSACDKCNSCKSGSCAPGQCKSAPRA